MRSQEPSSQYNLSRRKFVRTASAIIGTSTLALVPGTGFAASIGEGMTGMTIQQVIDLIIKDILGSSFTKNVDTIKAGDPNQPVTSIVTTMFATVEVIEKAATIGANFIIAHESTFYNHLDETNWLENSDVYKYKSALLKKHNMVVWRCHDYIHAHKPDGVISGVLEALGWEKYADIAKKPYLINLPPTSLQSIIDLTKKKLGIAHLRYVGDKQQLCGKIVFNPGFAVGRMQISALIVEKPDLLIVGEINEWETSEYMRDLRASGSKTSLLVLGHIVSEEPGLEWLVKLLQPQIKDIRITHIPSTDAYSWA